MSAWHIIRHPETGGVGVVHDGALQIHKNVGWIRVGAVDEMDKDHVVLADYAEAPDLDVEDLVEEKPTRAGRAAAAKQDKEI